jgi:tricorn protease-like protein
LCSAINSNALDYCPSVTPDGKYFFFSSRRSTIDFSPEGKRTYSDMLRSVRKPGNGNGDIYWVGSEVLEDLSENH